MKKYNLGFLIVGIAVLLSLCRCNVNRQKEVPEEIYELRIYTLADKDQEAQLDTYLEKTLLPALKRNKIRDIGVFKVIPRIGDSIRRTYMLHPHSGLSQFGELSESLLKDSVLQDELRHALNANAPLYERMEVVLLKPFRDMPYLRPSAVPGDRDKRVYELRSYESLTEVLFRNKVEMFNEGGEIELFEELGFNAVFYAEVLAGSRMPNLMYMTTFKDMETRDSLWNIFFNSPEWKSLIKDPYYNNNVSKVDIFLLVPTGYSDY